MPLGESSILGIKKDWMAWTVFMHRHTASLLVLAALAVMVVSVFHMRHRLPDSVRREATTVAANTPLDSVHSESTTVRREATTVAANKPLDSVHSESTTVDANKPPDRMQQVGVRSASESYGFMHYSEQDWQRFHDVHRNQSQKQRGGNHEHGNVFYQQNYEPTWSCPFERRIGKAGDGGKWVCDAYRIAELQECLVISIGSSNEWSFEVEVHNLNPRCEIFTFDHTIVPTNTPAFVHFNRVGLDTKNTSATATLAGLLERIHRVGRVVDLFKIDCEGCEWNTFPQFFEGFLRQVLIELHGVGPAFRAHSFFEAMAAHGYVIFHKEPNTLGCGGECIEYSFIKLNLAPAG